MLHWVWKLAARWLDRRGLGRIAGVVELHAGSIEALHAAARRALAAGDAPAALAALDQALALAPDDAALWCTRGAALRHALDFPAALVSYERSLAIDPRQVQTLSNLGEWHLARGDAETALAWLDDALREDPSCFEVRNNRIAALIELARFSEAENEARALIEMCIDRPEPYVNLGNILVQTGKGKQAVKQYRRALEIVPDCEEAHYNLATLLGTPDDLKKAIGYLERQIAARGDTISRQVLLATAYQTAGQLEKAEALCRRVLESQPDNINALITLGACLSNSGDAAAALELYERVVTLDPQQATIGSNVLFECNNLGNRTREEVFRLHVDWARRHEHAPSEMAPRLARDRNRPLRIGYVSGDFCSHPVGFLLRDVLKCHSSDFHTHCFSMVTRADGMTEALCASANGWEDVFLMTDDEFCEVVKNAEIDILVDLSGHTALNRLPCFGRRLAPVQATWIGYFHSTGLSSIDYYITDPHTTPAGSGQLFSETPVWLPHTRFCYSPPDYAPEVESRPAKEDFVFGSFNRLAKLSDEVVDAWAEIAKRVPGSRLVIKSAALDEPVTRQRVVQRFALRGVDAALLDLRGSSPHRAMLEEYSDIDVALDPFPFNGGMTTLEALWMGVPVVTIGGDGIVSRQTSSALINVGMPEMIFRDVDAYIAGAVALAGNRECLGELRQSLRARMAASPLCQPERFTRDLEALYRRMWDAWLRGEKLPPYYCA